MIVQETRFTASVGTLASTIMTAVEAHFAAEGLPFSRKGFLEQTSTDMQQLCLEAHYFGAEVFPEVKNVAAA
ncbi:hypothetical protein [Shinella zoogloeoides]|uniref:hypothetical protein n=1 Tax=Shinella zoogloeoides TaxID=352475 RepID=UPI00273FF2BE|nr:hypothetical protein [Shinella zoogloeoides]WLR90929.1 hypothetical protein Q9316_00700 [Shinella zoogloeoides]